MKMSDTIKHPYFGTLDQGNGLHWRGTAVCSGRSVPVDMISAAPRSAAEVDAMFAFIRDIARFDEIARQRLQPADEAVALYVEHHLAELSSEDLMAAFGTSNRSQLTMAGFLRQLELRRVGLYPASGTAVFDYGLNGAITQYVLAVTLGQDGSVHDVSMES